MNGPVDHGAELTPDTDAEQEPPFKPLTPEEAQAWRAQNPLMSPWRVVAAQAVLGVACALVAGLVTQRSSVLWSALYGAAVVVIPGGLMARGVAKGARDPAAAAVGFMLWELVKIALAVAMLVAIAKFAHDLSWPALLVNLVLCTKMGWLVLLWRRRPVVK